MRSHSAVRTTSGSVQGGVQEVECCLGSVDPLHSRRRYGSTTAFAVHYSIFTSGLEDV